MLNGINSSVPLQPRLIKWAGALSNAKPGHGFSRASGTPKQKTTGNTKGGRGGQWYIHKHRRRSEVFDNAEANSTRAPFLQKVNAPAGRGSAWVPVRKGGNVAATQVGEEKKKHLKHRKEQLQPIFRPLSFGVGWKKLGRLFSIWTSSILLFCNMKVVFCDYKEYVILYVSEANTAAPWTIPLTGRAQSHPVNDWKIVSIKHIQPEQREHMIHIIAT